MNKPSSTNASIAAPQASWEVGEWAKGAAIGRNSAYNLLNGPTPPRNVKLGNLRRIIESPSEYLNRIEKIQHGHES